MGAGALNPADELALPKRAKTWQGREWTQQKKSILFFKNKAKKLLKIKSGCGKRGQNKAKTKLPKLLKIREGCKDGAGVGQTAQGAFKRAQLGRARRQKLRYNGQRKGEDERRCSGNPIRTRRLVL
jgi:hypothetical protein